ncbi:hypothetical protein J2Y00_001216 [Deinococcus soli (ex Cha et al. 2016)]|uniref:Uncharacterized protein n=3 Tax=Deinococcus soli (ex Cha et al. 2016) TaxID=1309411 RepID=A0ACC6KCV2_9DEIO|nr:hypothetical protein [Deinococcus soli (ex Cha et al. 2016)]MDR6326968.1 hypothetical protein [Deinococcus soli (ex Cha et al. 2016)]MDR6750306.1 hypothetical protein [Deinococcus soli (ex Cha et al. 2016)]
MVVLLGGWSAMGVGTLTLLPGALAGIALTALIGSVWGAVRRRHARVRG